MGGSGGEGEEKRVWGGGLAPASLIFCCHLENNTPIPVVAVCSIIVCAASHAAVTQYSSSAQTLLHSTRWFNDKKYNNDKTPLAPLFVHAASFSQSLSFSQYSSILPLPSSLPSTLPSSSLSPAATSVPQQGFAAASSQCHTAVLFFFCLFSTGNLAWLVSAQWRDEGE